MNNNLNEASSDTNDLLDAVEKAYERGGLRGVIGGASQFGLSTRTTVEDILDDMKTMFDSKDMKFAAKEIKGFLKPQDYAKFKTRIESLEQDGKSVNEEVGVDARTGMFRRTLTRLEQTRAKREGKTDKYQGMYDDGSGKGVIMPKPISFNKESKRFTVEIDGRTKALREAMKRVEMYRKLREEKKKKTIMGSWKEEVEITEASNLTKGQILDAVGMQGSKFEVNEEELSPKQKAYRAFFQKSLKKFGKDSPASMDDGEKKKFFDYVKANWKG